MRYRNLGQGLKVSALGIGCMPMNASFGTSVYGAADPAEAEATIRRAIELGVTFFDTAEVYGPRTNEELLGRTIAGRRDGLLIATKFGFRFDADGKQTGGVDSSPANIARAVEGSLKRLGIEAIDLYYQHRVDPATPIEETVEAMARLVREGKVRHLGLSEAGAATIRRAQAVHPISALQSEYSLWERDVEEEILPLCRELGIGFVPYSPLGRGFLTGSITRREDLPEGDYRLRDPRYDAGNFEQNMGVVEAARRVAARHDASAAQVALAWLLAQGDHVVPIPGVKRRQTLEDSVKAVELNLTDDDLAELDAASPRGGTAGPRYAEAPLKMVRI